MTERSDFATELLQAMTQALAHASGAEADGTVTHSLDVADVDARAIRQKLNLTQTQMAVFLGTSVSGYRKWEQGDRQPSGAARTLLRVMEREPEAVMRALQVA